MKNKDPLSVCVRDAMDQYFDDLNGQQPTRLYNFFIGEVEKPFLQVVMQRTNGNQSLAARILGINRNTLRTKLKNHKLD